MKDEKFIKNKPTRKLKHTNSILEYFAYFCQMSSKSILTVLSYTVSKLVRFLRHSVDRPPRWDQSKRSTLNYSAVKLFLSKYSNIPYGRMTYCVISDRPT